MAEQAHTIVVCGGGLAGRLVASSLVNGLGSQYRICLIEDDSDARFDVYYGSVTAPSGYEFYRSVGLDEPTLFLKTSTSFSFGTSYEDWPSRLSSWMQCHHLPFPLFSSVPLQHYLTQHGQALEPLLISAQAARHGVFAHPPQDPSSALSRAEYGYQFDAGEWTELLGGRLENGRVQRLRGRVERVDADGEHVRAVVLNTGDRIEGELFVDCTGPGRAVVSAAGGAYAGEREILASWSVQRSGDTGPPMRKVVANSAGWTSATYLQGAVNTLSITASGGADQAGGIPSVELGRLEGAWRGNCVAIGHAAAVFEPLTAAPMIMLQRDIERLMELVPAGADQSMERREFNRRYKDDVEHAGLFQKAFFRFGIDSDTPYWRDARRTSASEALDRKIAQFEHRGLLVRYDLEPFNDEDWLILHSGMGRRPAHHDRQLDGESDVETMQRLSGMRQTIDQLVSRMPPHHAYVQNMKRYLERQAHV